jgi:hypothetical protein
MAEWEGCTVHLKTRYPYIFSLIVRTHPLRGDPSSVVI